MKSILLILIGYITCTLKCEMNQTEAEEKTDNVESPNEKGQQIDVQQPKDAVPPEGVETTDAVDTTDAGDTTYVVEELADSERPEDEVTKDAVDTTDAGDTTYAVVELADSERPEDEVTTDAVDTTDAGDKIYAVEELADSERPEDEVTTDADDTTYAVEELADSERPEDEVTTDAVDTTDADDTTYAVEELADSERPEDVVTIDAVDTTDAGDITYALEQLADSERPEDAEKTEATKKQQVQADDTGLSKIKVEDALRILEKSKKKYTSESIALIKKLEWLRSTFHITELMIDHKIDPNEDFDYLSDTQNSSNILRKRVKDDFAHIKQAILDASNFESTVLKETKQKLGMEKVKKDAKRYKTNFIATHSDRENLEKIYLADSD